MIVDSITSLLCKEYFLKFSFLLLILSHTANPSPPITIRLIIVTLTSTFELYEVSEEKLSLNPIRSKPALQKAEIE